MGIDQRVRCMLPTSASFLQFGAPKLYRGEFASLELMAALNASCDTFLDVGANVGYYTLYAATRSSRTKTIHFFEPDATLFQQTRANIEASNLNDVFGHQLALDQSVGQSVFLPDPDNTLVGRLAPHEQQPDTTIESGSTSVLVSTTTFEAFARAHSFRRACVKVDVEGAEFRFLAGVGDAAELIDSLIIEILGQALADGFVVTASRALGMHAYYISRFRLQHSADGQFDYVEGEYNWLFSRLDPTALAERLVGTDFTVESGRCARLNRTNK